MWPGIYSPRILIISRTIFKTPNYFQSFFFCFWIRMKWGKNVVFWRSKSFALKESVYFRFEKALLSAWKHTQRWPYLPLTPSVYSNKNCREDMLLKLNGMSSNILWRNKKDRKSLRVLNLIKSNVQFPVTLVAVSDAVNVYGKILTRNVQNDSDKKT